MSFYGVWETWKIVYTPVNSTGGLRGVAFVEAGDRAHAMQVFQEQYQGKYFTVQSIQRLADTK